jgi:hypothetical protein
MTMLHVRRVGTEHYDTKHYDPKSNGMLATGIVDKKAFVLGHRPAAKAAFEGTLEIFREDNPLLIDLRRMFDSIAKERGATRVSSRAFKRLLPELRRKFPQLAMSFARMDPVLVSAGPWLMWEDFARHGLSDAKLETDLKRSLAVVVYGLDRGGKRVYKDDLNPAHLCEKGSIAPPLMPWETAHVAEWRIDDLRLSRHGYPAQRGGMEVRAGASIASVPFRAAGVCGYLRFWPSGYWTETQRRRKTGGAPGADYFSSKGASPEPSVESWCCVGVVMPAGTHLNLRLFVGDEKSTSRGCSFGNTTNAAQLFSPAAHTPPDGAFDEGTIVVGVEIMRNVDDHHGRPRTPDVDQDSLRGHLRPRIKASSSSGALGGGSSCLLKRSQSVPAEGHTDSSDPYGSPLLHSELDDSFSSLPRSTYGARSFMRESVSRQHTRMSSRGTISDAGRSPGGVGARPGTAP